MQGRQGRDAVTIQGRRIYAEVTHDQILTRLIAPATNIGNARLVDEWEGNAYAADVPPENYDVNPDGSYAYVNHEIPGWQREQASWTPRSQVPFVVTYNGSEYVCHRAHCIIDGLYYGDALIGVEAV